MTSSDQRARLAVDIGGTFTDVVLETGTGRVTTKVLTTYPDPERGVMSGIGQVMKDGGLPPSAVGLIIHGTTLATNALIERRGAKTALIVTEGHRDSLEMAYENRFEQYDINIDRPEPLVPRYLRLPVRERMNKDGDVLIALDERAVRAIPPVLQDNGVTSVAIGLLHAYANPAHEKRIEAVLKEALPDLSVTLASEVAPEIREFDRQSTACANAYVRPLMERYLFRLDAALKGEGFACPFLLMTSGGGLTTVETAAKFPIRLVESGPAGGAILAGRITEECAVGELVSFDMGGTTAKICLIDDATPMTSRTFEVDRVYRFKKGSGLPVRIPVIEMVEIGAGGGSIASIDALQRIQVGPESAGSDPGPVAYARGGERPTVTDGDIVLGRIIPDRFAGGSITLDVPKAQGAVDRVIGAPLGLDGPMAAFGLSEVVDENMAAAARAHAVEWGKDIARRAMVAFGGAAPLHAARLADKLGLSQVIVPTHAGVGSAIGFLMAPIKYEVVRSRYMRLSEFDPAQLNAVMAEMRTEALEVVRQGAPDADLIETRQAFMRYVRQGHEIAVDVPSGDAGPQTARTLDAAFEETYRALYGRSIPGMDIEVLSWTLTVSTASSKARQAGRTPDTGSGAATPEGQHHMFDPGLARVVEVPVYLRPALLPGHRIAGPALITEDQTTTVVTSSFDAEINSLGYIVLIRKER